MGVLRIWLSSELSRLLHGMEPLRSQVLVWKLEHNKPAGNGRSSDTRSSDVMRLMPCMMEGVISQKRNTFGCSEVRRIIIRSAVKCRELVSAGERQAALVGELNEEPGPQGTTAMGVASSFVPSKRAVFISSERQEWTRLHSSCDQHGRHRRRFYHLITRKGRPNAIRGHD